MPLQTGLYLMPPVWLTELDRTDPAGPVGSSSLHSSRYSLDDAADAVVSAAISDGVTATMHRDGLTMFEFHPDHELFGGDGAEVFPALSARTALLNAFQAVLHSTARDIGFSTIWQKVPVTHRSLVHADLDRDGVLRYRANDEIVRPLYEVDGRRVMKTAAGTWVHLKDSWVPSRELIEPRVAEETLRRVSVILDADGLEALRRWEVLLASCAAFEARDTDTSVVLSWALIEYSINRVWADVAAQITSPGRTTPKNVTSKLNAVTTVELLRMTGAATDEICDQIDAIRATRNRWLHHMTPVSYDDAKSSLKLACYLVGVADGLPFSLDIPSGVVGVSL